MMRAPFLLIVVACMTGSAAAQRTLVVAADGSGRYRSVQAAFDAVPRNNTVPVVIRVRPGVYREKLRLDSSRRFVRLEGEDAFTTILTWDDHSGRLSPRGDTINTYTSESFLLAASDFSAQGITFDNGAGYSAGQAVAVQIRGDRVQFQQCRFTGNQDVLFPSVAGTRQYFRDCYIEGTTDFIFGPSTAWFERCHINSKRNSHVTAASTPREQSYGYVFHQCVLTSDSGLLNRVSLGRPWRPYASVTYLHCYIGGHVLPEGWNNWRNPENEKTARFSEYASFGPGAQPAARAPWTKQLRPEEAAALTLRAVLSDWTPTYSR